MKKKRRRTMHAKQLSGSTSHKPVNFPSTSLSTKLLQI